jgi:phenylacetate-CoA ligase
MPAQHRIEGFYSEQEHMPREERDKLKAKMLREFLEFAWTDSDEIRQRLKRVGIEPKDITSLDDWKNIPVFNKKELIERQKSGPNLGGLLTCELGELSRIYQSPGPIYDPEGREPDYWGWAEGFYAAGFRAKDLVQMTFSYHLTPAGLMLEQPLREIGCAVIPAGPGNTATQIELMTGLPVTGFVGMASYLRIIADKAVKAGFDLRKDFKLETAFVAAERLPESLRNGLERDFGMIVRQGYGTADLGCIAYECPELGGMHIADRCHVEVCDPETYEPMPNGEIGEVVVTPLIRAYPLLRFATGDLSYIVDEPCQCGRTSFKLGGIVGRVDDTAKVKGQFIYPSQAAEVLRGFEQISRWQIRVENPGGRDALILKLDCEGDIDQEACAAAFQKRMKLKPQIEFGDVAEDAPRLVDERSFD